ncbi:MAG: hypothetical protein NTU80_11430 [Verrucomicrobia bacterium]|nr:hypothetical protein [Verrucomicrobiota bacterium]
MSELNPETPESEVEAVASAPAVAAPRKKNFYQRLTASMPLLITIIVHVVLIGGAAAIVVQQNVIGKKKTFEAANQNESVAEKQVEHRLQVARRGGASSSAANPVSANRIFSTAENALQMPAMPDLPTMGSGGFGGFGSMGSGVGLGQGAGMATSLGGGGGLGGRGFMSMNFLGLTSQNVSKVVFVVDTSTEIMDLRKGGFRAFSIIREEIMRLVGGLPPGAQFNVILYRTRGLENGEGEFNIYKREMSPATSENKKDFFEWMTPVNTKLDNFGPASATRRTGWRRKPLPPESGVDPLLNPPTWARAMHAALEQAPDTVFVITAGTGRVTRDISEQELAKRRASVEKERQEYAREAKKEGTTLEAVQAARQNAIRKASNEFAEANKKLIAAGKDPIVASEWHVIFRADVQAALKKNGITITLDGTGWTKKDGTRFAQPPGRIYTTEGATWNDLTTHIARLQRTFLPQQRASINLYLFVGPDDKPDQAVAILSDIAKKNGGKFQLLTTKRLEEIRAKELEAQKKGS